MLCMHATRVYTYRLNGDDPEPEYVPGMNMTMQVSLFGKCLSSGNEMTQKHVLVGHYGQPFTAICLAPEESDHTICACNSHSSRCHKTM